MKYDSTADILLHIKRVAQLLTGASQELIDRANKHDQSKLESPEKELFDIYTPQLKELIFGSDEYKTALDNLKPALDHHYDKNSHHPQHYSDGVDGMDLFDIVEMYFDWVAAGERTKNGDIFKSIEINKDRFNLSDQLTSIFKNTAREAR